MLETADGKVIAIAEAALVDYSRMRLRRSEDVANALVSKLHGPGGLGAPAGDSVASGHGADTAGELLENNSLLLNLNEPYKIADTRWIKPGKVIREVSLSTEGGKACVDFASSTDCSSSSSTLAGTGQERDEKSDARTVSRPGLDLPDVIAYASERGIGVIVYVNRRHSNAIWTSCCHSITSGASPD